MMAPPSRALGGGHGRVVPPPPLDPPVASQMSASDLAFPSASLRGAVGAICQPQPTRHLVSFAVRCRAGRHSRSLRRRPSTRPNPILDVTAVAGSVAISRARDLIFISMPIGAPPSPPILDQADQRNGPFQEPSTTPAAVPGYSSLLATILKTQLHLLGPREACEVAQRGGGLLASGGVELSVDSAHNLTLK